MPKRMYVKNLTIVPSHAFVPYFVHLRIFLFFSVSLFHAFIQQFALICHSRIFISFNVFLFHSIVRRRTSVPSPRIKLSLTTRTPSLDLSPVATVLLASPTSTWYWSNFTKTIRVVKTATVPLLLMPSFSTNVSWIPPPQQQFTRRRHSWKVTQITAPAVKRTNLVH